MPHSYPTITFVITSIAIKTREEARLEGMIAGLLTLRDVTRPITVPVAARLEGATLIATGRFALKQTDYGIKPVSVGGVVSVKDTVNIAFEIAGR